ncbi:MAG: hypothetical protein M3170_01370 [Candidatus Dormibacteraeota bacterium]|nr:hypothetical protein [Candidatus Dormibacteraeota bacterium]
MVASVGVEGELSQKHSVGGDDADVGASDEEYDLAVAVGGADGDVAQLAEVAQGDLAGGVDAVPANPVVGWSLRLNRPGLEAGVEDDERGLPAEGTVRSVVVVVLAKGVELELQVSQ